MQRPVIGRCLLRAAHQGNRSILPHSPPALPQTSLTLPPLAQQTHPSQKEKYLVFLKSQTATTFFSPLLCSKGPFSVFAASLVSHLSKRGGGGKTSKVQTEKRVCGAGSSFTAFKGGDYPLGLLAATRGDSGDCSEAHSDGLKMSLRVFTWVLEDKVSQEEDRVCLWPAEFPVALETHHEKQR